MLGFFEPDRVAQPSINSLSHYSEKDENRLLDAHHDFPALPTEASSMTLDTYVNMCLDVLGFRQHLLVTRNFQRLPHFLIDGTKLPTEELNKDKRVIVDVWALSLRSSGEASLPHINLATLLAFILQRARAGKVWKKYARLRMNTIVDHTRDKDAGKEELLALCKTCRLPVSDKNDRIRVFALNEEAAAAQDEVLVNMSSSGGASEAKGGDSSSSDDEKCSAFENRMHLLGSVHLRRINGVIAAHSSDASVTFLPMPPMPESDLEVSRARRSSTAERHRDNVASSLAISSFSSGDDDSNSSNGSSAGGNGNEANRQFMANLYTLTRNLGPTVLCNAAYNVISTQL
jgi:hypothetical protein